MGRPKGVYETRICKLELCTNTFESTPSGKKQYCSKKCSNSDKSVLDKIRKSQKKTWDDKYDGKHPMQTNKTKDRFKQSMLDKYNVTHALKCDVIRNKQQNTINSKYGVSNILESGSIFREKSEKTKLDKYGSSNYNGSEKRTQTKYETICTWNHVTPLFTESEFMGVTSGTKYGFKCNSCNHISYVDLNNGYIPHCKGCSNSKSTSTAESEIMDYILSLDANIEYTMNDRGILPSGAEIDIYIPQHKLGIEFNGVYWHSDLYKSKEYHLKKTKMASSVGVTLIHIFDYQWNLKRDVVKSMIASKLGFTQKIHARKCEIRKVSSKEKGKFLNRTHIQGKANSSVNIGLFYDNSLVSIATFNKSRYDKTADWELVRFSSELHTTVIGGFSKLISYFVKNYNPVNILSYSDRTISNGNVYYKNGFTLINTTIPNYYYFKNGQVYSRELFQKHKLSEKLERFDINQTEVQNMKNNGYLRFWDCGNLKFIYTNKKRGEN
jgi:hypothetical protein